MVDDVNTYADGCWDADEQPERSDVLFWLSSCLNECRQRGVELYVTYTQAVSDQVWAATLHRIAELVENDPHMGTVPFDPRVAELVTITKIKPGDRVALYHGHGDHKRCPRPTRASWPTPSTRCSRSSSPAHACQCWCSRTAAGPAPMACTPATPKPMTNTVELASANYDGVIRENRSLACDAQFRQGEPR